MAILLKNAQVVTLNDENKVLQNCCVGINGSIIDYIGDETNELYGKYEKVIDCKGKTVMPGFVNAHNHAAMTLYRNYADDMKLMDWLFNKIFPLEDRLTEDGAFWASMLAVVEMIKSGTTTFNDMYFFMNKTVEAVGSSGMRAMLSRGLQGETGEEDLDYRLSENLELFTNYNNSFDGRIKVALGPHSIYTCSVPYLKKLVKKSEDMNIPIHIHVSETREEVSNCKEKHGVSPVKLLDGLGMLKKNTVAAHCVIVDDEDMRILAERGVNVVHNSGSNLKLASGIAPVTKMLDLGINVCLGTDGASSNNNLDMLEEIRMATYLQKVSTDDPTALPVDTVLRMAAANGANALGFNNLGTVEVGMLADLIIINTEKAQYYPKYNIKSAIVYSGSSSDVETVIINGNLVMENRNLITVDEERVLYKVQRWAEKLTSAL